MNPWMPSMVCCSAPGRSTESRERTAIKNIVSSSTTSISMAKRIRDRSRWMLRMNVQRLQQRQHRRAKQTIQECGKSQLFHFQTSQFSDL